MIRILKALIVSIIISHGVCSKNNVHVLESGSENSGSGSYHTSNRNYIHNDNINAGTNVATTGGLLGGNGLLFPPMIGLANPGLLSPGISSTGVLHHAQPIYQGYYPGLIGQQMGIYSNGGSQNFANNNNYEQVNKNEKEDKIEKAVGKQAQSAENSAQGYTQKQVGEKDNSAQGGYFNDEAGKKLNAQDAKSYEGEKQFNKEGKIEDHTKTRKGYRKGHNTKGSKSSHTKNAAEKVETFFDEAHDEAGNANFDANRGAFEHKEGASYQGQNKNEKFGNEKQGKKGAFEKGSVLDNSAGDKGQFGQQGFYNSNKAFGHNIGTDFELAKGHTEKDGFMKNFGTKFF